MKKDNIFVYISLQFEGIKQTLITIHYYVYRKRIINSRIQCMMLVLHVKDFSKTIIMVITTLLILLFY